MLALCLSLSLSSFSFCVLVDSIRISGFAWGHSAHRHRHRHWGVMQLHTVGTRSTRPAHAPLCEARRAALTLFFFLFILVQQAECMQACKRGAQSTKATLLMCGWLVVLRWTLSPSRQKLVFLGCEMCGRGAKFRGRLCVRRDALRRFISKGGRRFALCVSAAVTCRSP